MGSSSESTSEKSESSSEEEDEEYTLPKFDKKFNFNKDHIKFSKNYRQVEVKQSNSLFKGLIAKKPTTKYAIKFLNDISFLNMGYAFQKETFNKNTNNYNSCGVYIQCSNGYKYSQTPFQTGSYFEKCGNKDRVIGFSYNKKKDTITLYDGKLDKGVLYKDVKKSLNLKKIKTFPAFDVNSNINQCFKFVKPKFKVSKN
jgi:hypothetical protein